MKPLYFTTALAVTAALSASAWATPVSLTPSLNAYAFGGATNETTATNPTLITPTIEWDSSSTGGPVSIGFSGESYTGLDSEGNERTMTFSGTASASAAFGTLKAAASGTVTNAFFNPANAPYYDPNVGIPDSEGVPDFFSVTSEAKFTDKLIYGGTATNYTSTYYLHLTGDISGGGDGFVIVDINHGGQQSSEMFFAAGSYDIPIQSQAFVSGPDEIFSIRLYSSFQSSTQYVQDGDTLSGTANFANTLNLWGVSILDNDTGQYLTQNDIGSESGTLYAVRDGAVTAVPEPVSLSLLALGGGLLMLSRRRQS